MWEVVKVIFFLLGFLRFTYEFSIFFYYMGDFFNFKIVIVDKRNGVEGSERFVFRRGWGYVCCLGEWVFLILIIIIGFLKYRIRVSKLFL